MNQTASRRRGVAVMWALVILTVLGMMMMLVTRQGLTALRLVERRQYQLQAEWLARGGVELAAAKLLAEGNKYAGETVEPIPGGKVRIRIETKASSKDIFHVSVEARYPSDEPAVVVRNAMRSFKQVTEKASTRLVVVPSP